MVGQCIEALGQGTENGIIKNGGGGSGEGLVWKMVI